MAVRCYSTGESMAVVMIHPQCLSQVGRGGRGNIMEERLGERERERERGAEGACRRLAGERERRRSARRGKSNERGRKR